MSCPTYWHCELAERIARHAAAAADPHWRCREVQARIEGQQHASDRLAARAVELPTNLKETAMTHPQPRFSELGARAIEAQQAMKNTAPEFLHRAATIMEERGRQYDKPGGERSMGKTVAAFNAITGQDMTEEQGWAFMLVLKQVRFFSNTTAPHRDSLEDAIAYSALLAESALKEVKP